MITRKKNLQNVVELFPSLGIVAVMFGSKQFLLVSFDTMDGTVVVGMIKKKESGRQFEVEMRYE